MNKGFAYYFKQAFKIAAQSIWKNKNVIKSMVYFFMSLLARMTIILGAMTSLADVRQAKIAKTQRTIDVPRSLTYASKKPMWTKIMATVIEVLMYLGGFLLVSLVCGAIFSLGLIISQFVAYRYVLLVYAIFAVPCLIIYLIYTIIVITVFSPTSYVIDSNPELSAGDVVSVCVNSMKSRGKGTVILSVFVPSLIIGTICGICIAGFIVIGLLLGGQKYTMLLMLLWALASILILGFTVPVFKMTQNISLVLLFEDIALDPVNAQKRTAGINIKRISGARVDREEIADNLSALFDEGIEEKKPSPENVVHKHKPKLKAAQPPAAQPAQPAAPQPAAQPAPTEETAPPPVGEDNFDGLEEEDDYPEEAPAEDSFDEAVEVTEDDGFGAEE